MIARLLSPSGANKTIAEQRRSVERAQAGEVVGQFDVELPEGGVPEVLHQGGALAHIHPMRRAERHAPFPLGPRAKPSVFSHAAEPLIHLPDAVTQLPWPQPQPRLPASRHPTCGVETPAERQREEAPPLLSATGRCPPSDR